MLIMGRETAQIAAKSSQRRSRAGNLKGPGTMIAKGLGFLPAAVFGAVIGIEQLFDKPTVEIHYAPGENLELIDVRLIEGAREKIDMAAYVMTSGNIRAALEHAQGRGVKLNLVVEETELEKDLLPPADSITVHHGSWQSIMHLKAYAIDGRLLRTGSANFSYSGLHKQNNDLVIICDPKAVAAFERQFREMVK